MPPNLGRLVKMHRLYAGLTQDALAVRIGLKPGHGRTYISMLESNRVDPMFGKVVKIAGALDLTVVELLTDKAPAATDPTAPAEGE